MVRRRALWNGKARGVALAASLVAAPLAGGCAQATDPPGSSGYVLLDRVARGALTVAQDGWEGAPLLPVALDASEPAMLRGAEGERSVELQAGMLAHVRGVAGEIDWLEVGEEIRDDRLLVHGTEAAAAELALWIGGERAARGDGLWIVSAEDILDRGSFLQPPEGVLEILPDASMQLGDLGPGSIPGPGILGPGAIVGEDDPAARPVGSVEAGLVGVYAAGVRMLWLDAAGGYSLEDRCTGEVLGAGRFFAVEDRVVLQPGRGALVVLARDQDRLVHPGGAEYAPLLPEMPKVKEESR